MSENEEKPSQMKAILMIAGFVLAVVAMVVADSYLN